MSLTSCQRVHSALQCLFISACTAATRSLGLRAALLVVSESSGSMGGVDGGVCPELIVSPEDKRSYRMITLDNGLVGLLVHDPEIGELLEQRQQETAEPDHSAEGATQQRRPKRQRAGGGFGMGCCASAPDSSDEDSQSMGDSEGEESDDEDTDGGDEEGPKTKSAAAALTVGVGSFADPPHVQGLAHFLEHMLFMGSERYTDENETEEYLSAHGGYSNAYTEVEHTTFYFELEPAPGVLDGALDRWSAFFTCPLVKEDCLAREIDAINSEFQGVEQNDTCRQQQLLSHDAIPGHPCCNFLWGNAKSLKSATRDDLMSFWQQHYNAAISKLVLLGGESLDELEAMAHKYFDELRPKEVRITHSTATRFRFRAQQYHTSCLGCIAGWWFDELQRRRPRAGQHYRPCLATAR